MSDQDNTKPAKKRRGFAAMSPEKQREIAAKGGKSAHVKGTAHEFTVEEARSEVVSEGLIDDRNAVIEHWATHQSWFRSPILLTGEVVARPVAYELVVGFTRLGNLLGLMDREDISAARKHRVWIGEVTGR